MEPAEGGDDSQLEDVEVGRLAHLFEMGTSKVTFEDEDFLVTVSEVGNCLSVSMTRVEDNAHFHFLYNAQNHRLVKDAGDPSWFKAFLQGFIEKDVNSPGFS